MTATQAQEGATIAIVPFALEDLDAMMVIEECSFTAPWSRQSYEELSRLDNVAIWVAKDRGELIGYMLLQRVADEMELHTFAVAPERRRKGIGRMLLDHMCAEARRQGVAHIYLQVRPSNMPARQLYDAFGFEPVALRRHYYHDNGESAIVLRKRMT